MNAPERDPVTGQLTTGHEWNGIKELDNRVPRAVFLFLAATVVFCLIYWVLMPAWPLGSSFTRGLLGIDQRDTGTRAVGEAVAERSEWTDRIAALDYADVGQNTELMGIVRETGSTLFGDNCAVCHGTGGRGGPGFPDLTDNAWLWGGSPEEIAETLRVGINATHPETRFAQMPAFGGMLASDEISAIVSYIRSNAEGIETFSERDSRNVELGADLFAANCAACHGEDGRGAEEMGAPDLMDDAWLEGSDRATLISTISDGRQGHMPDWENRLTESERRILTLYVMGLGDGNETRTVEARSR